MADTVDEVALKVSELSVDPMAADPPSNNALKRELKKKQKEDEKRLKEEEKKKKVAATQNSQSHKDCAIEDDDMDPTQYYENRHKYPASQKITGINPYPHKFQVSTSVEEYIQKYTSLNQGEHLKDVEVNLAGRIMKKRTSSSKLYFYDLYGVGVKVQVMADARDSDLDEVEFSRLHGVVKRGDIVGICGYPGVNCGIRKSSSRRKIYSSVDKKRRYPNLTA
ncbi:hypothetical protein M5K25_021668 [Dendrobium thyrsiflorum]|uniref:lysine--tRNA ligase n=1 Tax=Dendrobium thyrsiflorum TaxID=117978 RepID=A0ABD0U4S3_DENTH